MLKLEDRGRGDLQTVQQDAAWTSGGGEDGGWLQGHQGAGPANPKRHFAPSRHC